MLDLPPDVLRSFSHGRFSIKQKPGSFNGIWTDMATEKTIIKDSKGNGGIVGLTRKKTALVRWTLTRHVLSKFSSEMRTRAGVILDSNDSHEESRPTAMKRDEQQVMGLIDHIKDKMSDSFDTTSHPPSLINISTGMHASAEVQQSLLKSVTDGSNMAKSFVEGALSGGQSKSFYSPITRSKLKSFEEMTRKTKLKCRSGDILTVHINPELIFRRALVLANSRDDVTVERVLSYPIGLIPTSLFHDDGTMRKTCKADLVHQLEEEVPIQTCLPEFNQSNTIIIRDGMAVLQSMNVRQNSTFGDVASRFVKGHVECFRSANVVYDTFDRYDVKNSIKIAERERRTKSCFSAKVFQIIEGRCISDWKKILSSGENKQSLIRFLGNFAVTYFNDNPLQNSQQLFLAGMFDNPEIVRKVTNENITLCPDLACTHEEADTRIIVHAMHANRVCLVNNVQGRIIVKSHDTDVLVLLIHFFPKMTHISELWFHTAFITATKDARRFIPVHTLCSTLGSIVCYILPAAHALSGCDTTSSMFGIGKKSLYKTIKEDPNNYKDLSGLCNLDKDECVTVSRKLVSKLYDQKSKYKTCHIDLNKLRYKFATAKESSLVRLPPSEATFLQHVLRAAYQTRIWMTADQPKPVIGSPLQFGWKEGKFGLDPVLFLGQMSSDFLQDLVCTCKGKSVCNRSCVCAEQNLSCTELCPCPATDMCHNTLTQNTELETEDE